jgi:hypothetical protein
VPASIFVHLLHIEDRHGLQVSIYLVKWKGFPSSENTWEKYEDVTIGGLGLINDFKKRQLPGASWPDQKSLSNLLSGWCCVMNNATGQHLAAGCPVLVLPSQSGTLAAAC